MIDNDYGELRNHNKQPWRDIRRVALWKTPCFIMPSKLYSQSFWI